MSDVIKASLVFAIGVCLAAILHGGVYQMVAVGAGSGGSNDISGDTEIWAYRLNRFTGEVVPFTKMVRAPLREPQIRK